MYAGFWKRFCALIIDAIIMYIIMAVVVLCGVLGLISSGKDSGAAFNIVIGFIYIFSSSFPILYWTFFESTSYQATPGKMCMGIKVCDLNGQRLSFVKSLGRNLCKIISNLTANIGYVMAGFTVRKQALHDIISNCLVIDKNADINSLKPLPQKPLWYTILMCVLALLPMFLLVVILIAGIGFAIYFATPSFQAKAGKSQLLMIKTEQKIYNSSHGVYALDFKELRPESKLKKQTDKSPLDNNSFSFVLRPDSVVAVYKNKPSFNLTACYDIDRFCIDRDLGDKDFRIASPEKCCKQ